ncbi:MAG: hypothetical protein ACOY3Y_20970 [Acidobacteriota bacterium]
MSELFTERWARAWRDAINRSEAFRCEGSGWDGVLVVSMPGGSSDGVALELEGGSCRAARRAREADRENADIVIEASPDTWRSLFAGRSELWLSILLGRFHVTRGNLGALRAHLPAARALLAAAGSIAEPPGRERDRD